MEKKKLIATFFVPVLLVSIMWMVKLAELVFDIRLGFLGVHPLQVDGLQGIALMPFIHGDLKHLAANTVPFFILTTALFYFYRGISVRVLLGIWLLSGIWVWFGGRDSWHIGASGVIYGLSSFLFFSGLIRKNTQLSALALIVAFLYGSLIWGIFPDFFPKENISWEGHLGGFVSGIILAVYYRNSGPKPNRYTWENEEPEDDDSDENAYWKTGPKHTNTT